MTVLASDNFNRADGGLGANWTESFQTGTGDWAILTNQIHPTGTNGDRSGYHYNAVTPPGNQYSQLLVVVRDTGAGEAGPAARLAVAADTYYLYRIAGANTLALQKRVAGVLTNLAGSATPGASGQTLRIECEGTNLRGILNGTLDVVASDSDIANGRFGIYGTFLTEDLLRFDNWEGGDLLPGAVLLDSSAVTTNAPTYASNSFTPKLNDLLVVFAIVTGTVSVGVMTDSQGLGFTRIATALKSASADRIYCFIANRLAAASAMTVTVDVTGDNGTGAIIFVYGVERMSKVASFASKQIAQQDNQAAATPAPVFPASVLTTNLTLGTVGNATNPATLTPPTSWTESTAPSGDVGFGVPTTGGETVFRNNGFTGTTVTWGSASASAFGSLMVELDASFNPLPPLLDQHLKPGFEPHVLARL